MSGKFHVGSRDKPNRRTNDLKRKAEEVDPEEEEDDDDEDDEDDEAEDDGTVDDEEDEEGDQDERTNEDETFQLRQCDGCSEVCVLIFFDLLRFC